jgi:membrane complex biogenesis BtpA family protein
MSFSRLFGERKALIGMLHAPALPGAPASRLSMKGIRNWLLRDAAALCEAGFDGLMLENFGDAPFHPGPAPMETVASLAVLAREVKARFPVPLGINVLRNDGLAALFVAAAAEADFIRVNVYTGARLTDQGLIEGQAHLIQRERRRLGCERVLVFADVDVKHSAPLAPRPLAGEVEETLSRGRADAVIVSGRATGAAVALDDLRIARAAAGRATVLAGSGAAARTVAALLEIADGVIAGTALKAGGVASARVDPRRARAFIAAARG